MITLTAGEIAQIVGGRLVNCDPDILLPGPVEFDSRKVTPGSIFLALPGQNVNGHDFAESSGAELSLLSRDMGVPAVLIPPVDHVDTNASALEFDTNGEGEAALAALAKLARYCIDSLVENHGLTVIGVTGSAGKTSTKDMIASVVRTAGPTVAPPGSFNNEIGHPYTALHCDETTRYLIAEMSARGVGHISYLAHIAPPTIGVVLNVGTAHLGEFGSRETIAQAKGELVEALPASGTAILNADDDLVRAMAQRTSARVMMFSQEPGSTAPVRAENITLDSQAQASFALVIEGAQAPVSLQVAGEHQVSNALAAAAVGAAIGLDVHTIAHALTLHQAASVRRMEVHTRPNDGVVVINDSYNANPDSMRAGLRAAVQMASARGRQVWAVLGRMGELGTGSYQAHLDLGLALGSAELGVDHLVVVGCGPDQSALARGAQMVGVDCREAADHDSAVALVNALVAPDDVVLVKASYSDRLWIVAEHLLAADPEEG